MPASPKEACDQVAASLSKSFSRQGILNRWGLAAAIDSHLPQVRGRDRLLHLLGGHDPPKPLRSEILVRWGPDLSATLDPSVDGSLRALYVAQWVRPALLPIIEACLRPGSLFVDVGANVGLYSTWAARIVGASGTVIALEPAPWTRTWLERICVQNELDQVEIVSSAAGASVGRGRMQPIEGASGRSRMIQERAGSIESSGGIEVSVTTLDELLDSRVPALIKIDVEGHEKSVLEGARQTMERTRVPVVFEAPDFGGGSGTLGCVRLLDTLGYRVLSLTPRGIRAFDPSSYSHNLLAVHDSDGLTENRLRAARFPRSQNA